MFQQMRSSAHNSLNPFACLKICMYKTYIIHVYLHKYVYKYTYTYVNVNDCICNVCLDINIYAHVNIKYIFSYL